MAPSTITVAEFRRRFPLGSTSRVVLVDEAGRYVGIVSPAALHAEGTATDVTLATIVEGAPEVLSPELDIAAVMARFDEAQRDELAVVDAEGQLLGLLTETYVRRRYGEELEKAQRQLFGEE